MARQPRNKRNYPVFPEETSKYVTMMLFSKTQLLCFSFYSYQPTNIPCSDLKESSPSTLVPLSTDEPQKDGFFKLFSFEPDSDAKESSISEEPTTSSPTTDSPTEDAEEEKSTQGDIWAATGERETKRPRHRTWDGFITGNKPPIRPLFLNHGGPIVFDALLTFPDDPSRLGNTKTQLVNTKTYLSSLLALAVGRDSVLFQRFDVQHKFRATVSDLRISGYTKDVLEQLQQQCSRCGSSFITLRAFIQSTYSSRHTRCRIALASAFNQILQVVQQYLAIDGRNPASLLQLESTIKRVSSILEPLIRLVNQITDRSFDEDVLALVYQQVCNIDGGGDHMPDLIRQVLSIVSNPWIQSIEEWLGTRREDGIPFSTFDIGKNKAFVKVEPRKYIDDFGEDVEHIDFYLDYASIPSFLPHNIAESIFETGKNLRFIRSFHSEHPLAQPDLIDSCQPPHAEWQYSWDSILSLEKRVGDYQKNLQKAIKDASAYVQNQSTRPSTTHRGRSSSELQFFGLNPEAMETRLQASIKQLDQCGMQLNPKDELNRIALMQLRLDQHAVPNQLDFTPHWSLIPALSFGNISDAQAHVVNRESLRLLFKDHDLRKHINLQKEFQLLGSGLFCTRLTHALFDPELETAERQNGVALQGSVMGLRLGGRDTWPPASSELRLALMGLLTETYESEHGTQPKTAQLERDGDNMPGDLSFAVRGLSPAEIDKCMDPDSLEAMDFLRLAYKPPSELASIIEPTTLIRYDRIFKHLLRVLRMLYVGNQLFRTAQANKTGRNDPSNDTQRFIREANHFVSCIASYSFDTGINIPWRGFETRLNEVERDLNKESDGGIAPKCCSPSQLGKLHSQLLDRIMSCLFLRKRQQPVLKLLEDIFVVILRFAKQSRLAGLSQDDNFETDGAVKLYSEFRKKMQIFLAVCKGLTEKSRAGKRKGEKDADIQKEEEGIGEDSVVSQLVTKLDGYNYYTKRI